MGRRHRKGRDVYPKLTFLDKYIDRETPYLKENISFEEAQRRVRATREEINKRS